MKPQFKWIDCSRVFRPHETTAITIMNNIRASIERLDSQSRNDARESNQFEWMWWKEHPCMCVRVRVFVRVHSQYNSLWNLNAVCIQLTHTLVRLLTHSKGQNSNNKHTTAVCASLTFDYSLFSHSVLVLLFDIAEIATTSKHSSSFFLSSANERPPLHYSFVCVCIYATRDVCMCNCLFVLSPSSSVCWIENMGGTNWKKWAVMILSC